MALFKQRKSRFWWVSIYRGPGLPRIQVSTGTEDRAKAEAVEATLKLAHRGRPERDRIVAQIDAILDYEESGILLADSWAVYASLPHLEVSAHTLNVRRQRWGKFAAWCQERFPRAKFIHQVSRQIALDYAAWLLPQCQARKTFNAHRADLATITKALMVRGNIPENPWLLVETLSTRDSKSGRAWTVEEEELLQAAAAGTEWHGAATVARYTGLRLSDIAHLRWDMIAGDRILLAPSKTKRHRIKVALPIHPRLAECLGMLPRSGDLVFPGLHRRKSINSHSQEGEYQDIIRAAGIEAHGAKLSFHNWRHTFRTRLAEAGVSKDLAQRLGGWTSDISELYNHDFEGLRKAIEAL